MKNKPYLISLASYTDGVDRYVKSLSNLQDSVDLINVVFQPHFMFNDSKYFIDEPYPNHLMRFDYLPKKDLDKDRWWIFTDTADVIFQAPIPDLDATGKDILVCFEGLPYKENGFWTGIIDQFPQAKVLLDLPIFNMGCWAMKGHEADKMLFFLKAKREEFGNHPNCDQLIYNLWLNQVDPKKIGIHSSLFTCLYANIEKGMTFKTERGFENPSGELYSVVHANGSTKGLLND